MNWKNLSIASLFAALSLGAVAANASEVKAQNYMYGDHLDIAKVLSVDEGSSTCGIVKARLTYLDSMGNKQAVDYKTIAQDCPRDN